MYYTKLRVLIFIKVICFLVLINFSSTYGERLKGELEYTPNEILVRFEHWVDEAEKDSVRQGIEAVLIKKINRIEVEYWRLPNNITIEEAVEILSQNPAVKNIEPNYLYKTKAIPNDSHFNKLWYLKNSGQSVNGTIGLSGADISAQEAWDIETGSSDIVIAVIDSGVAYDHPDLINNVWTNVNEIADNGIDDDGNGYLDDVHGWDFVNEDNNPSDYSKDVHGNGHGTHVAGIIAAEGNNSIGIAGVMWKAQIMPLKIFDLFENRSFSASIIQLVNIVEAIVYAVDNGAKVINCSFGGGASSQFQFDAIEYANQKGVLVVVAAGNDTNNNDNTPTYPSRYDLPNIISVAATNESDELASYSNYGAQTVHVAAPGGGTGSNMYSTIPPEREVLFYDDFESGGNKWVTGGIYEPWSITYNSVFNSNVVTDSTNLYHENEDSYLRTAALIDAENCRGLHLQFDIDYILETDYDFLYVEGSADDITYIPAYYATGNSLGIIRFLDWEDELEMGKFYLRLRLKTDLVVNYDGVYIDNFLLTGIRWEFDGDEYEYKCGTSMAAPVVSGIAGLIWSLEPTLTHLEVKNIILNSTDPIDSLYNKVTTGGRVNVYRALTSMDISPNGTNNNDSNDTVPDSSSDPATPTSSGGDGGGGGGCFIGSLAQ